MPQAAVGLHAGGWQSCGLQMGSGQTGFSQSATHTVHVATNKIHVATDTIRVPMNIDYWKLRHYCDGPAYPDPCEAVNCGRDFNSERTEISFKASP